MGKESGIAVALLAVVAIGAAMGGKKKRRGNRTPAATGNGCPPGWIDMGDGDCLFADECDPARPDTIWPGYQCIADDEGVYHLLEID